MGMQSTRLTGYLAFCGILSIILWGISSNPFFQTPGTPLQVKRLKETLWKDKPLTKQIDLSTGFPRLFPELGNGDLFASKLGRSGLTEGSIAFSQAAKAVADADNFLILTWVNEGYLDFLHNWMQSLRKLGLAKQVLLVAEDEGAYVALEECYPGQVFMFNEEASNAGKDKTASDYGSKSFNALCYQRAVHIRALIEVGFSVLMSDTDMVWVNSPLPHIFEPAMRHFDVIVQNDAPDYEYDISEQIEGARHWACTCLMLFRPTLRSIAMLDSWIKAITEGVVNGEEGNYSDQELFNWALNFAPRYNGTDVGILSQKTFPSGNVFFNETWRERYGNEVVIVHNNHIRTKEAKTKRFEELGYWADTTCSKAR